MISNFYEKFLFLHPVKVLILVSLVVSIFATGATKLKIDASSETLLLKNDADLLFAQEVTKKFYSPNILIIAFSPNEYLLSLVTLNSIKEMSVKLETLDKIGSITSILNVPLLQSSNMPLKDIIYNIPTLENSKLDLTLVKNEFLSSPIYRDNLVSADFKTTAIVLNLKNTEITSIEQKDELREKNHILIKNIRSILKEYKHSGELFLGGVDMISDDLISFIKNDLLVFGSVLLFLLAISLWFIFKELKWVILPLVISISSIVSTTGLLGFFGWKVTVISSNFVSIQLIITFAIVLHLIVRYKELDLLHPDYSQKNLVLATMMSKLSPSFFAILTTIVGFSSLAFSSILPIVNLGWMMSGGIAMSLILSFIIFPALLIMLPKSKKNIRKTKVFTPTNIMSSLVKHHKKTIFIISAVVALFSLSGATRLVVENSFINYFQPTTEIYKGMEIVDKKLGGTTPLDIIVKFKERKITSLEDSNHMSDDTEFDSFDSFDNEFEETQNENKYWFTDNKLQLILKIHDYLNSNEEIGNVQSIGTILKLIQSLNDNELDSFSLALLYNKLPLEFKKTILDPYLNIDENEIRFATRIIDSNPKLRRDELINKIDNDLKEIIDPKTASFKQSNLMILYNNMLQSLFDSQIITLGFVLIIFFIMFLSIFRNLKIALIAIITNTISVTVIFGFMGWLNIPLDLMTITIAAISLGIGVDDAIHYIHRFYEELKQDNSFTKAMQRSHNSVGYAMCYTSFAIILGFSILLLSNFTPTIYFGFLTIIAMITSLLGSLLLLPSMLIIFKPTR
ncbi:MAG: MMPL family transporter [Sulfurospirillum sp.]|nr:MMPL family transporter [Sulfurospirillum sp.]MBL0702714.1 MMPL family transporter [Sulfurospirillum sp.]